MSIFRRIGIFLFRDLLISLLVAFLVAFFIRSYVVSVYKVPTSSMLPNLWVGDFILAWKIPYGLRIEGFRENKIGVWKTPERGEIFVFRHPNAPSVHYVKRVVALPGDRIEIKKNHLFLNNVAAEYLNIQSPDSFSSEYYEIRKEKIFNQERDVLFFPNNEQGDFGPLVVPPDHVFVLGDNRDTSEDSRYWGVVSTNDLEGKVTLIWMSLDQNAEQNYSFFPKIRWSRVFHLVVP